MNKLKICALALSSIFFTGINLANFAKAEELSGTLLKIKNSGQITLAYRDSSIPFSYIANDPQQPIGYSHDISLAIVEEIKKKLALNNIRIRYNLVTSATRIPLVQNGTVDLECGSTTNNSERARQVDFSTNIFIVNTRLLVKKSSGIKDFPDLKGKNVVVTAGTTSERLLRAYNEKNNLGVRIISAKDHGESFLTLEAGRATAFMLDDVLLYSEKTKARNPDDWEIVGNPLSQEVYGCMLRKNDVQFKTLVDDTIKGLYASGEIKNIYSRWFEQPIPPNNTNLRFPVSETLQKIFDNPSDDPIE